MTHYLDLMFSGFWQFIGCFAVIYVVSHLIFKVINRTLRTIKVALRGWPPDHLDADGDFFNDSL